MEKDPGKSLLTVVRAGFVLQGRTLNQWCQQNGIDPANAAKYLLGQRNGRVARAWRKRMLEESRAAGLHIDQNEEPKRTLH